MDGPNRILPFKAVASGGRMTVEKCKELCFQDNDYLYAGVQYASECWCGNETPNTPAPQSECFWRCSGDYSQKCGGPWRMNVYQGASGTILYIHSLLTLMPTAIIFLILYSYIVIYLCACTNDSHVLSLV